MNTANKEALRAWLFQLLARVELADDLRAEQTESHNTVVLTITFYP